jgi:hypothetical protein
MRKYAMTVIGVTKLFLESSNLEIKPGKNIRSAVDIQRKVGGREATKTSCPNKARSSHALEAKGKTRETPVVTKPMVMDDGWDERVL